MKPTEEKRIATGDEVMMFFTAVMNGEIKDAFGLDASLQDRLNAAKELAKRTVDINGNKDEYEKYITKTVVLPVSGGRMQSGRR